MLKRPGRLGINIERQMPVVGRVLHLRHVKAVEAQQPVGLIQAVLAHQRRLHERQHGRCVGDRREGTVVNAPQIIVAVEAMRRGDDGAVIGRVGTDDHLRRLARRSELRGAAIVFARILVVVDRGLEPGHRAANPPGVFFRREPGQPFIGRQLDIDRQAIGIEPGRFEQFSRGIGNGLEMDIATKIMVETQRPGHRDQLFHRVVRSSDDPRREKQPLDIVAFIETQRQLDHFIDGEARPANVG